jgi:trigger factor
VKSIKERELPEPDDEFAQLASEFDTIDELRSNLRDQVRQAKRAQQAEQIRNAAIDALLERVDVPVPEAIVQAQFDSALQGTLSGLNNDDATLAEALAAQGRSREEFEAEARTAAEKDVKKQLLLDALADDLQVQVGQDDLTERLVMTSRQYGIEPQQLFGYLQENNQLPAMVADVRRGLGIAAAIEAATVTDTDGNTIDTSEFFGRRAEADETDEVDEADETDEVDEADEANGPNASDEAEAPDSSDDESNDRA